MDRPIFIVGPPRCGTTLAARILGLHSRIFMPGETHFFHDVYANRAALGDPATDAGIARIVGRLGTLYGRYNEPDDQARIDRLFADPGAVRSFYGSCGDYGAVMSRFMALQTQDAGKARWGNHAPKDLFHVDDILRFYPRAMIVVCVRDLRDFLSSYRDKWRATTQDHVERIRSLYHPVLTTLLWKASVRQAQRLRDKVPRESLVVVKYEELVCDTEHVVRDLCARIGERFEPRMLEVSSHNSSSAATVAGIFTSSVGRWEGALSNEEVYLAQRIAGREMEALGYAPKRVGANTAKVALVAATTPAAALRALNANRALRGPLLPYLWRRVASFTIRQS